MNPTVILTDLGKLAASDPVVSASVIARTPQGRFGGKHCVNIVESNFFLFFKMWHSFGNSCILNSIFGKNTIIVLVLHR